jgi:hypothetical protein
MQGAHQPITEIEEKQEYEISVPEFSAKYISVQSKDK